MRKWVTGCRIENVRLRIHDEGYIMNDAEFRMQDGGAGLRIQNEAGRMYY